MDSENPFARYAPQAGDVIHRAPISETRREELPKTDKEKEQERQNRAMLGALWNARKITTEKLHERGVKLDPRDMERYSQELERQSRAMKAREASGLAESVFLEGADESGLSQVRGKGYAWFGNEVIGYEPHPFDDRLRGTDAILFFSDPEDDRIAFPVAVDVTTDRIEYDNKFARDVSRMGDRGLSTIYWVETSGKAAFDDPEEGRIRALNLSVFVPSGAVSTFTSEHTDDRVARRVMGDLGPFIVRQMQSELEAEAMRALYINPREARRLSRDALSSMLRASNRLDPTIKKLLSGVLPTVWDAADRLGPMQRHHLEVLPESILERPPLPRG